MTQSEESGALPGDISEDSSRYVRVRKRRRQRSHPWRRRIVGFTVLLVLLLFIGGGAYAVVHYLPYLDQVRAARASAQQAAATLKTVGLDIDQPHLDELKAQLSDVDTRLQPFRDLLTSDPIVGLARHIPGVRDQIAAGGQAVAAADDLIAAGKLGLGVGQRYVDIKAKAATTTDPSTLADLVQLMATSSGDVNQIQGLLASARQHLDEVPANAIAQIREAHDLMAAPLVQYGPVLDQYTSLQGTLPGILGWGGEKRYLVLAEDPAELRPTGGFAGTYGILGFKDGRIVERFFHDIYQLDLKPDLPYVLPPEGLKSHLLGNFSWQLADANWSPDLPTSAQDAIRLYTLESGDANVDGVIVVTTYALDHLLNVIGPVEVPEYSTIVHPGETTLTTLALTRKPLTPDVNRKQFLDTFAGHILDRLFTLPPSSWVSLLTEFQTVGDQRLAGIWLKDPTAQALVATSSWGGAVRQDAGDYLFVVDSNVAPASKYNLVVTRTTDLDVKIDQYGNALNTLQLSWQNDSAKAGEPYASLRSYSTGTGAIYGTYVRVLTPDRSRLQSVSGGTLVPITGPEVVTQEAGRTEFANYLSVLPGLGKLSYQWVSPYPASVEDGVGSYSLVVQKQSGMTPEPVTLHINVPDGSIITAASPNLQVSGNVANFTGTLTQDFTLAIQYRTR